MSRAIDIADLTNRLSEYLDAVVKGEEIVICQRNMPFARITRMPLKRNRTKLGFDRGRLQIRGDVAGPVLAADESNRS
jgi:antitoxin (DNA-binding transcriptional repressor) of toxin-antitoxin stability system